MNWFDVGADGSVSNTAGLTSNWSSVYNSPGQWGINLEELHLFQNLPRELEWTGGKPLLQMKATREAAVADRFFLYRRPATEALEFIFSLQAVPDSSAGVPPGKYKMVMKMDAMVALNNPNDVTLGYPAGLDLPYQLLNIPYKLIWNIQRAPLAPITTTTQPGNLNVFFSHVQGGAAGPPEGFQLEPGEAATFGSSVASGANLDIRRGFVPSGGVTMSWDLKAGGLSPTDTVNFELKRLSKAEAKATTNGVWTYYNTWIGTRSSSPPFKGWQMDAASITPTDTPTTFMDQCLSPSIKPSQILTVDKFVKSKAVLMVSYLMNVEQATSAAPPDAFASRPYLLNEHALNGRNISADRFQTDRHGTQMLITAEAMNYSFAGKSIAAGAGGRNIYIGGSRQSSQGGSFNVISRRIPIAPPLSLAAFQNAIASGFSDHFSEGSQLAFVGRGSLNISQDPFPASAVALAGAVSGLPMVSRAIGNSNNVPYLTPTEVYSANNSTLGPSGSVGKVATDHSWMVNTALWDAWFLSGVLDGTGMNAASLMKDSRTPKTQFREFADGTHSLRNKRFLYYPYKPTTDALADLFSGENFTNSALNKLPDYLLVDGAFNVNSTSVDAWRALLASQRGQSLITAGGGTAALKNPMGTLGYAANTASSGTDGDWQGLRDLTNDELNSLATAIVTEVKARGPFLSFADFVNRRPNSSDTGQQVLGALQTAIDKSGLNSRLTAGTRKAASADFDPLPGKQGIDMEPAPARAIRTPGQFSQADLLTAIGAQLSVRSDTFIIRSYGDARDGADKIVASAWCEAVVQRIPEYVDPSDAPDAQNGWPTSATTLKPANTQFGRRFVIRSFRYLSRAEI